MKGFEDRPRIHSLTWKIAKANAEPHDNWPGRRAHPYHSVEWFRSVNPSVDIPQVLQEIQREASSHGWGAEEYKGFIWLIGPQEEAS